MGTTFHFIRCPHRRTVPIRELSPRTVPYSTVQYRTVYADFGERRAVVPRRMTQWRQRKGEELKYLAPKEEEIVVGVKYKLMEQTREQVREHALLQSGSDPQLL